MTDITIPEGSAFARFGGTVWPIPGEQLRELEHTLRYAQRGYIFNMQERLLVASVLNAYIELVRQTQKRRNEIAANLFAAVQND